MRDREFTGAVDLARERRHPGLDAAMGMAARGRDEADFLLHLAAGRGADAVAARLVLEYVGDPAERAALEVELADLAALARATSS